MSKAAKIHFDDTKGKFVASYAGHLLASSKSKEAVINLIVEGRCNKAKKFGVTSVEGNQQEIAADAVSEKFDINTRFGFTTDLVNMVVSKTVPSVIITGEGGLGKTHTVKKALSDAKLVDCQSLFSNLDDLEEGESRAFSATRPGDYTIVKGFSTPKGLYRTLYENRDKIVVFDDCDSVLRDPVALNLLKSALDSYDERWISWNSEGFVDDGLPRSFKFTGQIIFISNMPQYKIDQAIKSRSILVDLSMTTDQKIERMSHILEQDDFLPKFSVAYKREALAFLDKNRSVAKEISLRTLQTVTKVRATSKNWEQLAEYVLMNA